MELVSIFTLLVSVINEVYAFFSLGRKCWRVRKAVAQKVNDVEPTEEYAKECYFDCKTRRHCVNIQQGKCLKEGYRDMQWVAIKMVILALISLWMIGYALIKFVKSWYCPHAVWNVTGCVPEL